MIDEQTIDKLRQEFTFALEQQLIKGRKLGRRNYHGCVFACWLAEHGFKEFDINQPHIFFFIQKNLGLSCSQIGTIISGWDNGYRSPLIDHNCFDLGQELGKKYLESKEQVI